MTFSPRQLVLLKPETSWLHTLKFFLVTLLPWSEDIKLVELDIKLVEQSNVIDVPGLSYRNIPSVASTAIGEMFSTVVAYCYASIKTATWWCGTRIWGKPDVFHPPVVISDYMTCLVSDTTRTIVTTES
ncbi:hypothetical protein Bca4012_043569 [Brassica carinata]|uniref:Uncharacterized protein n=1 Tax=Brassica carinata TaxID=52824 RepID=A0A8X7QUK4_BRACI|nr:hypothetical protein Bca52824_058762 [Brassica carinata]